MEQDQRLSLKLKVLEKALAGLDRLMRADFEKLDETLKDGLRNGQAQKFEYCTELFWKTARTYLREAEGIDASTPKGSIKGLFNAGKIDERIYEVLITALDTRNELSHIYAEKEFQKIIEDIPGFLKTMQSVCELLAGPARKK